MYKPGQLITTEGERYRITKIHPTPYRCAVCILANNIYARRGKLCSICKEKISLKTIPLHISERLVVV